ncbi:MAG TPA: LytTR family DNA-binding domain-containing protein, partial [Caulobacteraceae bacterium]|nr:LytTR family DNA-binding domain-containing protein [Caulobacteraceae bacterium]
RPVEPFIWEYSSALVALALIPAVRWLYVRFPATRSGWPRFLAVHAVASGVFSVAHVAGFSAIRAAIYAALGGHYRGVRLLYEYRKDLVTYVAIIGAMALVDHMVLLWARAQRREAAGPSVYQLRDGPKTLRVPIDEIVAVRSARNYVEFLLIGGQAPLVRDTLVRVEAELAGRGFVRTHRSWLVNAAKVRAIGPAAAGDFQVELEGGAVAPLSRRFPQALQRLRQGPAALAAE